MNNLKEYRQIKALNEQDELRFKEMLGEIDQEKEILSGINTLDALMEYLNRPIARNKYIRDFINDKIKKIKVDSRGTKKDDDRLSLRSSASKISDITNMTNYTMYTQAD